MILHTRLLPTGGVCIAPWLIIIHSKYQGDAGLLAHEHCHATQQRQNGLLWFWWRYLTHQPYRLRAEVEAYRHQIACGADPQKMATHLMTSYRIGITRQHALDLLGATTTP